MNLALLRSEFLVALLHQSPETGASLREAVTRQGYSCRLHSEPALLLEQIPAEPPHIVVLDLETCRNSFTDLCQRLQSLSPETKVLVLCPLEKLSSVLPIRELLGIKDIVPLNSGFELNLLSALDRVASELYYVFENEQLFAELKELQQKLVETPAPLAEAKSPSPAEEVVAVDLLEAEPRQDEIVIAPEIEDFVSQFQAASQQMQQASDISELNAIFMTKISEALANRPVIFFKYLPAYASLLAAQTHNLPIEKIRGIGVNLTKENPLLAQELLQSPETMPQLRALMCEAFNRPQFKALSVEILGEVMGVFVFLTDVDIRTTPLSTLWESYLLHYQNKSLRKRNHDLEFRDPVTDLVTKKHLDAKTEEELARSRRTLLPTALIVLDIDQFAHYNSVNGQVNGNLVLKQVARVLKKSSRRHDVIARLENDQFCLLLPHTDVRGAAVKAERLRRILEGTRFHLSERQPEGHLTVSLGVSEYPTLCSDGESLLRSADEAMYVVKERGGNKVCVASVHSTFKPDFEVGPLPSRQGSSFEPLSEPPQNSL